MYIAFLLTLITASVIISAMQICRYLQRLIKVQDEIEKHNNLIEQYNTPPSATLYQEELDSDSILSTLLGRN
jgi:cell division protein FtsL